MKIHYASKEYIDFLRRCCLKPVVLMEITSHCNFKCDYCVSRLGLRKKQHMSFELTRHIVDQLPYLTTESVRLHVDGEPLLHPDFSKIVQMLSKRKLPVIVATNGSLLTPDHLKLDMDLLISMSVTEGEFRQRNTIYDLTDYQNRILEYLSAWTETITEQTILVQFKYYKDSDEKDQKRQIINYIKFIVKKMNLKKRLKNKFVRCKYSGIDHELDKKNCYVKNNKSILYFCIRPVNDGPNYRMKQFSDSVTRNGFCSNPWQELAILSDGRISFCCMDLTGGTAFTEPEEIWKRPLLDIWMDHRIEKIRRQLLGRHVNLPVCQRCLAELPDNSLYSLDHRFQ